MVIFILIWQHELLTNLVPLANNYYCSVWPLANIWRTRALSLKNLFNYSFNHLKCEFQLKVVRPINHVNYKQHEWIVKSFCQLITRNPSAKVHCWIWNEEQPLEGETDGNMVTTLGWLQKDKSSFHNLSFSILIHFDLQHKIHSFLRIETKKLIFNLELVKVGHRFCSA